MKYQTSTSPIHANIRLEWYYPSQSTGLDRMAVAGTRCVSVDAPGIDSPAPSPLNGLVYAERKRLIALCETLYHKQ